MASLRLLRFVLLALPVTVKSLSASDCFFPDGVTQRSGYVPCNPDAAVSQCCAQGEVCLNNGLCYGGYGLLYRGGCAGGWGVDEKACPELCSSVYGEIHPIRACEVANVC
jgi:hypothetical protein